MNPDGIVRMRSEPDPSAAQRPIPAGGVDSTAADPVLVPFVSAQTDADADREMTDLLEREVLPLARAIVARKLRTFSTSRRPGMLDDREDVLSQAVVALVHKLQQMRSEPGGHSIGNFAGYVAAVVHSTCAHAIRRRYPERARLKDRFRYVFSSDERLAIWQAGDGGTTCGLKQWRDREPDRTSTERVASAATRHHTDWKTQSKRELADATVELFRSVGAPVDLDVLVGAVAAAANTIEPQEVEGTDHLATSAPPADALLEQRQFLHRVWSEVQALPVRQRVALLLNLRDPSGRGMLWLFPICGIATLRDLASAMEIKPDEFALLWRQIPLDDATIARRLGCERQQVINLRMSARKRLWNRSRSTAGPGTEPMSGRPGLRR